MEILKIVNRKIMSSYSIILQDLSIRRNNTQTIQPPPYTDQMDIKTKIEITYNCLLRAQRLKHRISALVFAFYLGQQDPAYL